MEALVDSILYGKAPELRAAAFDQFLELVVDSSPETIAALRARRAALRPGMFFNLLTGHSVDSCLTFFVSTAAAVPELNQVWLLPGRRARPIFVRTCFVAAGEQLIERAGEFVIFPVVQNSTGTRVVARAPVGTSIPVICEVELWGTAEHLIDLLSKEGVKLFDHDGDLTLYSNRTVIGRGRFRTNNQLELTIQPKVFSSI